MFCCISFKYDLAGRQIADGQLVKRLRRRPLTAETGVRFPYWLLQMSGNMKFSDIFVFIYEIPLHFMRVRAMVTEMIDVTKVRVGDESTLIC